jgi:hypothetical protein
MINCGDPWRDLSKMQEFVSIRSAEAIKTVSYFNGFIAVCGGIERWAKLDRVHILSSDTYCLAKSTPNQCRHSCHVSDFLIGIRRTSAIQIDLPIRFCVVITTINAASSLPNHSLVRNHYPPPPVY